MAKTSFYSGSGPDSNDVSALENLKNQAQTSATNAASSASSAAASASSAAASVASLNEDVATQSTKGLMSAADKTKLDGIESNADVTDSDNVTAAGALMDSEVTSLSGIKTLTVPDSTTVSTFGASLVDDADAAAARTTLGLGSSDSPTFAGMTLDGDAVFGTNDRLSLGIQSGTNALQLYYFGNSFIENNAVADLLIRNNANNYDVKIQSDNGSGGLAEYFVADGSTGAAQLYWGDYSTNSGADGGLKLTSSATGIDVTGSITVSGTVDGRDVAADGTKLDTVETNADVTDTANVTAAGALMDSELTSEASVKAINQGLTTTDSPTFAALSVSGKTTTNELDLDAIAATISDTAVDIFVYDTRKDSDGGAWRKRTQHTSWYNETLNTATRGSRKEFPAVAVIVAESDTVTIYDGDDPDLPMWMVFSFIIGSPASITSVKMLQGKLVIGSNLSYAIGLTLYDFSSDSGQVWYTSGNKPLLGGISDRPANSAAWGVVFASSYSGGNLVNAVVNDVAMTVLPNAPIDAATGLPVPTIAVATDGGVSVIKDDGTVVDDTTFSPINVLSFSIDNDVFFGRNGFGRVYKWDYSADTSSTATYVTNATNPPMAGNTTGGIVDFGNDEYWASGSSTDGLNVFVENKLAANITSDFNTGWMNGDIKLATLSDTYDYTLDPLTLNNVTGSELVTNGDFTTDASNWTAQNSATVSIVSNAVQIENGAASYGYIVQAITTEVGKSYTLSMDFIYSGDTGRLRIGTTSGGAEYADEGAYSVSGVKTFTFTATSTTAYIRLGPYNNVLGSTVGFDNVSVRLAEEDRSVNGKGLQVFGSITKNPVATGADLVAYSGFNGTGNNYLEQPYNSDLDFGTGDFSVTFWYNQPSSANEWSYILSRGNEQYFTVRTHPSSNATFNGKLLFKFGSTGWAITDYNTIGKGWICVTLARRSGVTKVYVNGVEEYTSTNQTGTVNDPSNAALKTEPRAGSLALLRISATVPSPEQIKKIYEDEKVLFQENAQATLYGSSDGVTALAYDDSTELLHVGTSAGRSVFQGLRRVDNTTTAVGAAISASGGLVADE